MTADIQVRLVTSADDVAAVARALADVWGYPDIGGVGAPDMLCALAFSGGYVSSVTVDGQVVGGGYGWPTRHESQWRLHSHVVGFGDGFRAQGLGAKVKHHQRDWARAHGMQAVEWTYDPLLAANARFNLVKLGATVESFHANFYGLMNDAFHVNVPTDRFLVRWGVDDLPEPVGAQGLEPLLSVDAETGGPQLHDTTSSLVSVAIPADIVGMRRTDHRLAVAWQQAFLHTAGAALQAGAVVLRMNDHRQYVLKVR